MANRWLSVVVNDGESMANDGGSTNGRAYCRSIAMQADQNIRSSLRQGAVALPTKSVLCGSSVTVRRSKKVAGSSTPRWCPIYHGANRKSLTGDLWAVVWCLQVERQPRHINRTSQENSEDKEVVRLRHFRGWCFHGGSLNVVGRSQKKDAEWMVRHS